MRLFVQGDDGPNSADWQERMLQAAAVMIILIITAMTPHGDPAVVGHSTVVDPVCGMTSRSHNQQTPLRLSRQNLPFLFGRLRTKFAATPEQYLDKSKAPVAAAVPEGTIYTCPMASPRSGR